MTSQRLCLKGLEKRLSKANDDSKLLLRGMDLLHILRYFEYYRVFEVPELMRRAAGNESYSIMIDRGRQNMNTCLQWFFSDAENNWPQAENLSSDQDDIKVLNKVLATIWHYENSKDAMKRYGMGCSITGLSPKI